MLQQTTAYIWRSVCPGQALDLVPSWQNRGGETAKAALCHQGAPGSNPSSEGLAFGKIAAWWDLFWPLPMSGPSPCRQMVDLGIG